MFRVTSDDKIIITRGDSAKIRVSITDNDGNIYTPTADDKVVLTVKKTTGDKEPLITKTLVDGFIKLKPEDTEKLEYGSYVYDCQITTGSGDVYTFITPHPFVVAEEVTF